MNFRLHPVSSKMVITNFDEISIKYIDEVILNLERVFDDDNRNYNYLKHSKEENKLRNMQLERYKDTLDALRAIKENLYKNKSITNNKEVRDINNLKELQGTTPVRVIIRDKNRDIENEEISTWSGVLVFISEFLVKKDKNRFEEIALTIKGKKRSYFSFDSESLYKAKLIKNTKIVCEGNNSSDTQASICRELLSKMGVEEEIIIEIK